MNYRAALTEAMTMLAQDDRTVFLGQAVLYPGTYMHATLEGVPLEKRIEMPVAEEMQLGMSIGLALAGYVPVSIYPRWNFFALAANQAINHLDKMHPHVIVRVGVGSMEPLHPGPQHVGDFTSAFAEMMPHTQFRRLDVTTNPAAVYAQALKRDGPTVITEFADLYAA